MSSTIIPAVAAVIFASGASSALAFDAASPEPKEMRTHASHRAAVIEVIPANAVFDIANCVREWCEAAYAGQTGYVFVPVLISGEPVPGATQAPATAPVVAAY